MQIIEGEWLAKEQLLDNYKKANKKAQNYYNLHSSITSSAEVNLLETHKPFRTTRPEEQLFH